MFETLFGAEMPLALRFFIAFVIVLGLIGGTAFVVRRFGADRLGGGATRGRQPRLAVIDAAAVDGRRRLILIRRDNVEHLLMIGGPSDIVIEPSIVRAAPAPREAPPQRPPAASEALPRSVALAEGTMWPLQPHVEPAVPQAPRPRPAPIQEEPVSWPMDAEVPPQSAPPPRQLRPVDPLAGLAAELSRGPAQSEPGPPPRQSRDVAREAARENVRAIQAERQRIEPRVEPRMEPRPEPRPEPRAEPQPPADQQFAPNADQNLAEMAQRLEAALRRPAAKPREVRAEPAAEGDLGQQPAPAAEPKPVREGRASRADAPKPPQKSLYDSLEQEMASLLGRPNSKA